MPPAVRLPAGLCSCSFPFVAALAILVAGALLTLNQGDAAKVKYKSMIRMERYGNCPDMPDLPNYFNHSEVIPYGRTMVGRGTFLLNVGYKKLTKTLSKILKCVDRNDPNCELFQNWRFGDETCSLLLMKNAIWTPLFTFHPTMSCPLSPGVYQMENITVDIDKMKLIQFPEKGFWKVSILLEADKIPKIACFYFEMSFIKQSNAATAKPKSIIRMEKFGNCPELPNAPNGFNFSEVVPYGRTQVGRGTYIINHRYNKVTRAQAKIYKCADMSDPSCELFQNWRFGKESCVLMAMKNVVWTPLFAAQPPFSCPLLPGVYQMENITVDTEKVKLITFPDGYWKVSIFFDGDQVPNATCFHFECTVLKSRD